MPIISGLQPVVLRDLSVSFRDRTALTGVDLVAQPGRRIGLVGENGTGKSTLLRAVAGRLPETARVTGTLEAPTDLVLLGQEPPFRDDRTIGEVLAATLRPLREAVQRVEELAGDLHDEAGQAAYAAALEHAVDHDAWDADRRAEVAAHELGLGTLDPAREVGTLSGGQRTRLAIATVMTTRPACLLLDEPTNHLDDDAIEVLTRFLLRPARRRRCSPATTGSCSTTSAPTWSTSTRRRSGPTGRAVGGSVAAGATTSPPARTPAGAGRRRTPTSRTSWTGSGRPRRSARRRSPTTVGRPTTTSSSTRPRAPRSRAPSSRRKRDARRRLDLAERDQVRKPPKPLVFRHQLAEETDSGRLVQVRDLVVAGRLRLDRLDVEAGEHLLVTGANGSGKSTLLGVLAGRLTPTAGSVSVGGRVAELAQDVTFPDRARRAADVYADAVAGLEDAPALRDLGLVHPRDHHRPVGLLSVGQRRRLGLAVAVAQGPDLMLLDEPTNHLSPALAGEIEEALGRSPGAVVVASHDRWLRRRWEGSVRALG